MTIEQILEIVEKYKLRMPPTAFYELKADIVNFEEPTTKNDTKFCPDRKAKTTNMETILHCIENECAAYKDGKCLKYNSDQEPTTKNDLGVDCISRAEAIKCLECDFDITGKENMKTVVNYINSAHDKIVNLTSVTPQEPRWIPVSERLPEKNMRCLVAVGRFNFTEIATYSDLMGIIDHKIFYQGDVGHDNFKNITQYVKAWMPLLKSYKAESENKG